MFDVIRSKVGQVDGVAVNEAEAKMSSVGEEQGILQKAL